MLLPTSLLFSSRFVRYQICVDSSGFVGPFPALFDLFQLHLICRLPMISFSFFDLAG